jgi:hypothetical protein
VGKKAWTAIHFTICILKTGNSNTKRLAYVSLLRPILEYGAECWDDPYREGQISVLDWAQNKALKFAHHRNDSNWETLAQCRKMALFKVYMGDHDKIFRSKKAKERYWKIFFCK